MIFRSIFLIAGLLACVFNSFCQDKPKLIVGIVVDQMKMDYLFRFESKFSEDGFKRLMNEGFYSLNTHYNYIPTYTGPGHASVFSGTTPANHGIISNDWYVRELDKSINCVEDSTASSVGTDNNAGHFSPVNLAASNFADELRLSSQKRSKVVGVSIKNRGAILPAGHLPNGAYWFDPETGNFITSDYYMQSLPQWVKKFNKKKLAAKYLDQKWEPLLPIDAYVESGDDDNEYEVVFGEGNSPVFPYDLKALSEPSGNFGLLSSTPWGNTIVRELAEAAISGENLGDDNETDLLTISFSSTDYIGHRFGPNAIEIQDCYLRLDQDIAALLKKLDEQVGKGEYMVFLTADHAAAEVPQYLLDNKVPAGYIQGAPIRFMVGKYITDKYGEGDWFLKAQNDQVFLNREFIKEKGQSLETIQNDIAELLMTFDGIKVAYTGTDMMKSEYLTGARSKLQKGYHPQRSGDVLVVYDPGWFPTIYGKRGTTHGSGYTYDTHVPLLMYGKGIPSKRSVKYHEITDIVPTICLKYGIRLPNATDGQPIEELFD